MPHQGDERAEEEGKGERVSVCVSSDVVRDAKHAAVSGLHFLDTSHCIHVYTYVHVHVSFKKFSRRHSMLFNKYAVSVKRHIREGICIPLDVKPDLVRNITTRNLGCGQCA